MQSRLISACVLMAAWATGLAAEDAITVGGDPAGGRYALTVIAVSDVPAEGYAVTGEVRYEVVQGQAFLEMWSLFGNGGRYFSRSMDPSGPMGILTGRASRAVTEDVRQARRCDFAHHQNTSC